MPPRGENPITDYFPRVAPHSKSKTPTTPIQPKLKAGKRAHQSEEVVPFKESSRKKSKSKRLEDAGDTGAAGPSSELVYSSRSASRTSRPRKLPRTVIAIQDTPPSSPTKPVPLRQTTPPSSPLPELTPSPVPPPRTRNPSYLSHTDGKDEGVGTSFNVMYSVPDQAQLDPIPSSQTQTLEIEYTQEDRGPIHQSSLPRSSIPTRCYEQLDSSQSSNNPSLSRPDTTPASSCPAPEDLIGSSQTQLLDLIPTSPIIPEFDVVPSSQTQEFSYSQEGSSSPKAKANFTGQRISVMDLYDDELQSPAQLSPNAEIFSSQIPRVDTLTFTNSHTPGCESGPTRSQEDLLLTEPSLPGRDGEAGSYENLPDAVKTFQDMFGETFESLPPDFPMSLRF